MNTLNTPPLAPVLEHLFQQADAAAPGFWDAFPDHELDRLMHSKTEYLEFYSRLKDAPLPVSRDTGKLLYLLARSTRARHIVEFGTSFGISTLHLAAALRDNGGGRLIASEFEPTKVARARQNLQAGGVLDLVDLRVGDALHTLSRDLPESVDLLFLDGAKPLYPEVLDLVEPHLRPGSLIIADNADHSAAYLEKVRTARYLSLPFAADVELSMRV